jgi:hypothetical protein
MKTSILTIIIIFLSTISYSQSDVSGCLNGDCSNGEGTYRYEDNTIYIGHFQKNMAHGYGVCYYSDGQKYTGQWKNHTFHGEGTFHDGKGKIITGNWKEGQLMTTKLPAKKTTPKVYSVVIGVSSYPHMQSLKYTDDDAYKIYSFMKSPEGGALTDNELTVIIDEAATRDNILEQIKMTFAKAGENDMVMLYYSGHGLKDAILPHDYDGVDNKILYEELYEIIEISKAKQKICIIDACHSGGMLATKGINERIPTTAQIYYENLGGKKGGTAIITSSKIEEASIEGANLRQGVFSYFWVQALKGVADADNNKIVTISEAFLYVQKNVSSYTSNYQTPQLDGNFDALLPLAAIR